MRHELRAHRLLETGDVASLPPEERVGEAAGSDGKDGAARVQAAEWGSSTNSTDALSQESPESPVSFCRYAADRKYPFHICQTNQGVPTHGNQICFMEAKASLTRGLRTR